MTVTIRTALVGVLGRTEVSHSVTQCALKRPVQRVQTTRRHGPSRALRWQTARAMPGTPGPTAGRVRHVPRANTKQTAGQWDLQINALALLSCTGLLWVAKNL